MSNKLICNVIRCAVILLALSEVVICFFWYPFSISMTAVGLLGSVKSQSQLTEMWTQLIFYLLTAVPCFVVLSIFWTISTLVKDNKTFSVATAKRLKICSVILFSDLAVFVAGNIVFLILGWNAFAIIYFIFAVIGIFIAFILAILAQYAGKAAQLKEENESFI